MVYEKSPSEDRPKPMGDNLAETVGVKEDRKLRSRRERDRNLWSWLGMMGLVGWAVAVPTLVGIAGGIWIDTHFPSRFSWTLMLLFVGVVLGCANAWYWVNRESKGR
jgi:ATP synthase protein I